MGVAPAYVALIAEAWVDAAVRRGLPADGRRAARRRDARRRRRAAAARRGMDTLGVRREVTSPGGVDGRAGCARSSAAACAAASRTRWTPCWSTGDDGAVRRRDGARDDRRLPRGADPRLHDPDHRLHPLSSCSSASAGACPYSRWSSAVLEFLRQVCEPYLSIFRRFIPPIGPLDISPIVADPRAVHRGQHRRQPDPRVSARAWARAQRLRSRPDGGRRHRAGPGDQGAGPRRRSTRGEERDLGAAGARPRPRRATTASRSAASAAAGRSSSLVVAAALGRAARLLRAPRRTGR